MLRAIAAVRPKIQTFSDLEFIVQNFGDKIWGKQLLEKHLLLFVDVRKTLNTSDVLPLCILHNLLTKLKDFEVSVKIVAKPYSVLSFLIKLL